MTADSTLQLSDTGGRIALGISACLIASMLLGFCCYAFAGNSLNLFIGGVLFACLLTPPLTAFAGRLPGAAVCSLAIGLGIGGVWSMPIWAQAVSVGQWAICVLVLCSLLIAIGCMVILLIRLGCSAVVSSAIMMLITLAWLSFPIWMSGALSGDQLRWSILFHPLFAINGVVPGLGIWTEQQVAYGLTNFGQDVQYQLPTSAWPVIGLQSGVAALVWTIIAPRSMNQMDTEASRARRT